jgi:ankyrin repeat protein
MLTRLLILSAILLCPAGLFAQNSKQELNDQMWEAVRRGDAATVTAMLDKGADVNAKFRYGATALFKAAERGNPEIVKILLSRGADVSVKDTFYKATAMTWALDNGHTEVVKLLLEKDPSSLNEVLMTGVREGKPELVGVALGTGGVKPEALKLALGVALAKDPQNAQIVEALKKAGAVASAEVDAATLQSYTGKYKSEGPLELNVSVKNGKLFTTAGGPQAFQLMAIDKATFVPIDFDGITLTFVVEGAKVTGATLKQGPGVTQLKRVEEIKEQPKP